MQVMPGGTNGTEYPAYARRANPPCAGPPGRIRPDDYSWRVSRTFPSPQLGTERPTARRPRRAGLVVLLFAVPLTLVVSLGVASALAPSATRSLSDRAGRVTLSVPQTWSDDTRPNAGRWIHQGEDPVRIPDLDASSLLDDRFVRVIVESRGAELAAVHAAEVDTRCGYRACVSRGQPVGIELNGRRGLEQVLAHAGAEWTLLLTVESDRYLVTVIAEATEFAEAEDVDKLRDITDTVIIRD